MTFNFSSLSSILEPSIRSTRGIDTIDTVFDDFCNHIERPLARFLLPKASEEYYPRIDVSEPNSHYSIEVDLPDIDVTKVFAGLCIGMSMTGAKTNLTFVNNKTLSDKAKQKNNLAYATYLGVSVEFMPSINGDITYSYKDIGKFKMSQKAFHLSILRAIILQKVLALTHRVNFMNILIHTKIITIIARNATKYIKQHIVKNKAYNKLFLVANP